MDDRFNTISGWTLAAFGTALGLSIVGGELFHGAEPAKEGYPIEAAAEAGAEGGAADVPIATLLASADPAKGADVFKKCAACHTITPGGAAGVGPNVHGIMGQPIAKRAGFTYSGALTGVGGAWDWDKMDAWLKSPRKFADGTKMTFAGLSKGEDRANVIAYLNAQGSNLPLPAAPAAGAPAAAEAGSDAPIANSAETGEIANTGTPASGAPSVDPEAAR